MIRPNDIIDGKYEALRLLGKGGMSRVWLARDFFIDKLWAVKEVQKGSGNGSRLEAECLLEEACLLKTLDHPGLPRIVEVLDTDDSVLLVMDYVRGKSLDKVLEEEGSVTEGKAIDWGLSLCDVLAYLHGQKPSVIYRDMKPSNIIRCEDDTIRLIDFGIARARAGEVLEGPSLGTRAYAAPEQCDSRGCCDERSDIYSLGMTLARLVGWDVVGPQGEGARVAGVSAGFEEVVLKATSSDPAARYQSVQEMAVALGGCEREGPSILRHDDCTEGVESGADARSPARGRRKRGLSKRLSFGVGAIGLLVAALVLCGLCAWREESEYRMLLETARRASREGEDDEESDAEALCRKAIDAHPERSEPYLMLLCEVYRDDARFSLGEETRWESIARERLNALGGQEGYAQVCFDAGMLYYAYADEGDEVRGGARGAAWFEACSRACADEGEEELAMQADAYATIAGFYRDLALARQDGNEGKTYGDYWEAIGQVMDALDGSMGDGSGGDERMLCLRVCEFVRDALSSPVHLAGFARVGVTCDDVEMVWTRVGVLSQRCYELADISKSEERRWEEVTGADARVRESVEMVFGGITLGE